MTLRNRDSFCFIGRKAKWGISLAVSLGYMVLFFVLQSVMGLMVFALTILPVATAGFFLGALSGALTAVILSLYDVFAAVFIFGQTANSILYNAIPGSLLLVFLGLMTGRLRDLSNRLSAELSERCTAEERIKYMAYHDILTNLPNRSLLVDRLGAELAEGKEHQQLAVFFIDLDRFKNVNDSLGHDVGDELLKEAAKRLTGCIRENDMVARFGGDEFVILLPGVGSLNDAMPVIDRIFDQMDQAFFIDGKELYLSASIGIAFYPKDGRDANTLLRHADIAMYRAKEEGQKGYKVFDERIHAETTRWLMLANDLHQALEREEFTLYYQPIIELASGRIIGAEALIRWRHPGFGMVWPGEFISIAENTGHIERIGEWILQTAARQTKFWHNRGIRNFYTAVNLSARQFQSGNLIETVAAVLRETRLKPRQLELEITENAFLGNEEFTGFLLRHLKEMGLRLAIDDFGTGYSCLSYLRSFPIGTLKISRSFVLDLETDKHYAAIVKAIVAMAKTLKIRVVAEGVENQEQLVFLKSLGCYAAQGYLFSPPLPAEEMTELLLKNPKTDQPI